MKKTKKMKIKNFKILKPNIVLMIFFLFGINFNVFSIKFKKFTFKALSLNFTGVSLNIFNTRTKIECLRFCGQNILCSTVLYSPERLCKLFNILVYDAELISSSDSDVYVKYPRSCKQIKRFNSQAKNELYDIETPNGQVKVYLLLVLI